MEIRTCSFFNTRMHRVVYGMPTDEDFANDDGYTEFAGCVITDPMESWKRFECGASILEE